MAITNIEVDAVGYISNWNVTGSRPSCIQGPENDATFVSTGGSNVEAFSLAAGGIPSDQQITQVNFYGRYKDGGTIRVSYYQAGTAGTTTDIVTPGTFSYVSTTTCGRPGGTGWTPDSFGSTLEMKMERISGNVYCSRLYTIVTHCGKGGGLITFGFQWIPPLIAVASHCLMKREIVKILCDLKTRPSNNEDFDYILNAFSVRPKFCFL